MMYDQPEIRAKLEERIDELMSPDHYIELIERYAAGERVFSGSDLRGVDLSEADLRGVDLSGANLRQANLSGADLSQVNLYGADLSGAKLRGTSLRGANLGAARLGSTGATERARLDGAAVAAAQFVMAVLKGAALPPGTRHD